MDCTVTWTGECQWLSVLCLPGGVVGLLCVCVGGGGGIRTGQDREVG